MQNNSIIKLASSDGEMHYQYYCSKCHFRFDSDFTKGCNYCLNCGQRLYWSPFIKKAFQIFIDRSKDFFEKEAKYNAE